MVEYSRPKIASTHSLPIPNRRRDVPSLPAVSGGENEVSVPHQETEKTPINHGNLSRRRWMLSTSSSALSGMILLSIFPHIAAAAPPLTAETADSFAARAERAFRPKPARVLRPRMNLDFAVLLMRSSYNAVDDLDIVAMDQFQRDFFLIRQAEYKTYADSLGAGAMQQGDLADPNYFDFISFAQYATILREIANPPSVFEEQQPVEDIGEGEPQQFYSVVVKRNASVSNNDLPRKYDEIVGNAILDKLIEKFGDTASAIPKLEAGSRPGATTVLAAIQQMVNLFVISGFAWSGNASMQTKSADNDNGAGTQISITFTSPATLWSGSSLQAKKNAVLTNDFALKTAKAMMSRAGFFSPASTRRANPAFSSGVPPRMSSIDE